MSTPTVSQINLELNKPHPGQQLVLDNHKRFNVVNCGRRWGKSAMGLQVLIPESLGGFPVAWYAPTYGAMNELWRETLRTIPRDLIEKQNGSDYRLELVGGGSMDFWAIDSDPEASRGRKYKKVVIDEAAKSRHLKKAWGYTIRATLADYLGEAWFLSTPAGKNFFYELAQRGMKPEENPGWAYFHAPTSANPYIMASEIEALRKELTEHEFRQEVMAEFLEGVGIFFGDFNEDTHTIVPYEVPPHWNYIGGFDDGWANPACFLLAGIDHSGNVHVIDEWYFTQKTDEEKAHAVLQVLLRNGCNPRNVRIYADTAMWGAIGRSQGIGKRPIEAFWSVGLNLMKATKDRRVGWARLRSHLRRQDGIEIFRGRCPNLIREMLEATTDEKNIEDLDTDQSDHALDALRYLIMQHHNIPQDPEQKIDLPEPDNRPHWLKYRDRAGSSVIAGTYDEIILENSQYL